MHVPERIEYDFEFVAMFVDENSLVDVPEPEQVELMIFGHRKRDFRAFPGLFRIDLGCQRGLGIADPCIIFDLLLETFVVMRAS